MKVSEITIGQDYAFAKSTSYTPERIHAREIKKVRLPVQGSYGFASSHTRLVLVLIASFYDKEGKLCEATSPIEARYVLRTWQQELDQRAARKAHEADESAARDVRRARRLAIAAKLAALNVKHSTEQIESRDRAPILEMARAAEEKGDKEKAAELNAWARSLVNSRNGFTFTLDEVEHLIALAQAGHDARVKS